MGDDVIGNFMAMTGCTDEAEAITMLSTCDFDLATAVTIYHESHPQGGNATSSSAPAQPSGTGPSGGRNDDDQGFISQQQVTRLVDGDDYNGPGPQGMGGGGAINMADLMGAMSGGLGRPAPGSASAMLQRALDHPHMDVWGDQPSRARGPNYQGDRHAHLDRHDHDDEFVEDPYDGFGDLDAPPRPERPPSAALDNLYRPPAFAYTGNLRDVCENAMRQKKWVILNVLVRSDFSSGCINRDLWRDDLVKAMIPAFAVLYQCVSDTTEGQQAVTAYHLRRDQLPCMVIVNPLTRSVVQEIPLKSVSFKEEGKGLDPERFINKVTAFTEKNEFPEIPDDMLTLDPMNAHHVGGPAPIVPRDPPSSSAGLGSNAGGAMSSDFNQTEDEMLQAALKASAEEHEEEQLRKIATETKVVDEPAKEQPVSDVEKQETKPTEVADEPKEEQEVPAEDTVVDITEYQCEAGTAGSFKWRFRLPQGLHEEILKGDTPAKVFLQHLVQLLRAQGQDVGSIKNLELLAGFPPKKLSLDVLDTNPDVTIADLGLRSGDNITPHVV